jgi:hypothetical protein
MDLLQSPSAIAQQLLEKKIKADHVFFFAYIQPSPVAGGTIWSAADEMVRVNSEPHLDLLTVFDTIINCFVA